MKGYHKSADKPSDKEILDMLARIFRVGVNESDLIDRLTEEGA